MDELARIIGCTPPNFCQFTHIHQLVIYLYLSVIEEEEEDIYLAQTV